MTPSPAVELVLPVYNEQPILERSVRRLHAYLTDAFPFSFRITIADNASTDATWDIAQRLSRRTARGRRRPPGPERVVAARCARSGRAATPTVVVVHGHRFVDRPRRGAAARRSPAVRSQRRCDRQPAEQVLPRRPRGQARGHLAQLQPAAAHDVARAVQRRPMRLQGHPHRCARGNCCHWCENTGWFFDTELLVLAERTRAAHPRSAGGLGRRSGQPGRHPCDRARRPARRAAHDAGVRHRRLPIAALRRQLGRDPVPRAACLASRSG